jgi:selenocysteine lyase/cysteine desulfurase
MLPSHRRKFLEQLLAASFTGLAIPSIAGAMELLLPPSNADDEKYWENLKMQFAVPDNLMMMNAANLCPSPKAIHERVIDLTKALNKDVSFQYRTLFGTLRKNSIALLARFVGADESEIGITRNTSESNCMIVHGLDLKPSDEVIVWEQNHPSNREVWESQAKRVGFAVKRISLPAYPTLTKELLEPFINAITPNTKLISFSHISNLSGMALPAREICQMAKTRGIMTLVDGAQSLGSMNINLHDMGCTFYTASTHKWLMGPFENGVLYIHKDYFNRIWPAVIGGGWKEATTVDAQLCVLGQRNEPSPAALPETLAFHNAIGRANIENRIVQLSTYLKEQIKNKIPRAVFVTPLAPELSGGIVIINLPGKEVHEVTDKLYHSYGIATAPAGGIRLSPHIYNTKKDIDYTVKAIGEVGQ